MEHTGSALAVQVWELQQDYIQDAGSLVTYTVNPRTGALAFAEKTWGKAQAFAFRPQGSILYSNNQVDRGGYGGGVVVAQVDGETATLQPIARYVENTPEIGAPTVHGGGLALSPDGRDLYTTAMYADWPTLALHAVIYQYQLAEDGTFSLTNVRKFEFPVGSNDSLHDPVISPDGNHLYLQSQGFVWGFAIGSDGAVTALADSPYATNPTSISRFRTTPAITPDGKFMAVMDGSIAVFAIDPQSGTLTRVYISEASDWQTVELLADPRGKFFFARQQRYDSGTYGFYDARVAVYAIGADGTLALASILDRPTPWGSMAITPGGKYFYMGGDRVVDGYEVTASGELKPLASSPTAIPSTAMLALPGASLIVPAASPTPVKDGQITPP